MNTSNKITEEELIPFSAEIFVSDLDKVVHYYTNVLGFTLHRLDAEGRFASLKLDKSLLMVQEKANMEELKRVGIVLRFMVSDIQSFYKKVVANGANVFAPLKTMDYGLTRFKVKDPEGYIIKFSEHNNYG